MDLKQEFKEYRHIYNVYFDAFQDKQTAAKKLEDEIFEKDKQDIEAQFESKEKMDLLEEYMLITNEIHLILNDMSKVAERILYISEAAVRNKQNLELSEVDDTFVKNLSSNGKSTYAIDHGQLKPRFAGIKEVLQKQISEKTEAKYLTLEQIRNFRKNV